MYAVVGKILSVLEDLDRYVFDKMDPNTNCLDVLAAKIWGPCQPGQGVSSQVKNLTTTCVTNFGPGQLYYFACFFLRSIMFILS